MNDLLSFLHSQIPLTKSLGLSILSITEDGARIRAPLGPNHNHMGSAFGGSLSTMMILSGYIWLYDQLLKKKYHSHVILSREQSEYLSPVTSDIEVFAKAPSKEEWKKFEESLIRKGVGRMTIHSEIRQGDALSASFIGELVAKSSGKSP